MSLGRTNQPRVSHVPEQPTTTPCPRSGGSTTFSRSSRGREMESIYLRSGRGRSSTPPSTPEAASPPARLRPTTRADHQATTTPSAKSGLPPKSEVPHHETGRWEPRRHLHWHLCGHTRRLPRVAAGEGEMGRGSPMSPERG
jgi:hypothetical protein